VYLAENSLLLFSELSTPRERVITRVTLATGTATFSLRPVGEEDFFIQTPTDTLRISPPDTISSRIDAFLDGIAITAQADQGETVIRAASPNLQVTKGSTVFFRGGALLELNLDQTALPRAPRAHVPESSPVSWVFLSASVVLPLVQGADPAQPQIRSLLTQGPRRALLN